MYKSQDSLRLWLISGPDLALIRPLGQTESGTSLCVLSVGTQYPPSLLFPLEYVQLYIDFLLNKSIEKPFAAFYHGFHSVCASDAIMVSNYFHSPCRTASNE